ncbi:MAG TPA: flavodoxin domain-containing protein [Gemmatimonadaceae bacterium]|nr:flavodoxin domain-containing protein [Gemmatimonadaceae bacterium]
MTPVLIVFATKYGQTAKIANRIAEVLWQDGVPSVLLTAGEVPATIDVTGYGGVIVGAPVLAGSHPKAARRFVASHRATLDHVPTAFFSVSMSAAGKELAQQVDAQRKITEFVEETRWRPTRTASFAGAIAYTKYGPLTKWFMKRIAKKEGASTDTSRDHEFTDWARVDRFAHEFGALVRAVHEPAPPLPAEPHEPAFIG